MLLLLYYFNRFGPGPHTTRFTFALPPTYTEYDFTIELAPLDAVPHAVHLFLEQVAHGLWNGTYFYLNGPHVLQAGPQQDEEDETDDPEEDRATAMRPFHDYGLEELAFPDYSDEYPHVTWTLGFTGRPGGPDFYINKVDNTESHGPGGQYQHALEEQGDSCFGRIVEGREHLAMLFQQPIYEDGTDWNYFMEEPVEIVRAVIVTATDDDTDTPPLAQGAPPQAQAPQTFSVDPMIHNINEKLKRKPRLPKIEHAVEP
jgi:cyclophilin family peptidyl-prolyl cis-trans isomerase